MCGDPYLGCKSCVAEEKAAMYVAGECHDNASCTMKALTHCKGQQLGILGPICGEEEGVDEYMNVGWPVKLSR